MVHIHRHAIRKIPPGRRRWQIDLLRLLLLLLLLMMWMASGVLCTLACPWPCLSALNDPCMIMPQLQVLSLRAAVGYSGCSARVRPDLALYTLPVLLLCAACLAQRARLSVLQLVACRGRLAAAGWQGLAAATRRAHVCRFQTACRRL